MTYTGVTIAQSQTLNGVAYAPKVYDKFVANALTANSAFLSRIPKQPVASLFGEAGWTYKCRVIDGVPSASVRTIGSDVTHSKATVTTKSVDLAVVTAAFDEDRQVHWQASGANTALQVEQASRAVSAEFIDLAINGDASNTGEFDGLAVSIADAPSSQTITGTDFAAIDTKEEALEALRLFDTVLSAVTVQENLVVLVNGTAGARLQHLFRLAGYITPSEIAAGAPITVYAGVPIINVGRKHGTGNDIIPVLTGDDVGETDIYAVSLSDNGFHMVTRAGLPLADVGIPDPYKTNGDPVTSGFVELVAATILKNTGGAAVLKNVKVA